MNKLSSKKKMSKLQVKRKKMSQAKQSQSDNSNNTSESESESESEPESEPESESEPKPESESKWTDINDEDSLLYHCKYCGKAYSRTQNLMRHVRNICLKNPNAKCNGPLAPEAFVCLACSCRFKEKKFLTYHQRHECKRVSVCQYCKKKFSDPYIAKHLSICQAKKGAENRKREGSPTLFRKSSTLSKSPFQKERLISTETQTRITPKSHA